MAPSKFEMLDDVLAAKTIGNLVPRALGACTAVCKTWRDRLVDARAAPANSPNAVDERASLLGLSLWPVSGAPRAQWLLFAETPESAWRKPHPPQVIGMPQSTSEIHGGACKLALHEDGNTLVTLGHWSPQCPFEFFNDSGDRPRHEMTVRIYSAANGMLLRELAGHGHRVTALAVLGDIVASGDSGGELRLWSLSSGEALLTRDVYAMHSHGCVQSLALGRSLLASGGNDGKVRLWSVVAIQGSTICTCTLTGHAHWQGVVYSVALGDAFVVSAGGYRSSQHPVACGGDAKVWSLDGTLKRTLKHLRCVNSVAVSDDQVVTGCEDGFVRVWSISSFTCTLTLPCGGTTQEGGVGEVRLMRSLLVGVGGEYSTIKVWSLAGEHIAEHRLMRRNVRSMVISPRGFIASASLFDVKLWLNKWATDSLASGTSA